MSQTWSIFTKKKHLISKCLFSKHRDRERHFAFNVEKCKEFGLFDFLIKNYEAIVGRPDIEEQRLEELKQEEAKSKINKKTKGCTTKERRAPSVLSATKTDA